MVAKHESEPLVSRATVSILSNGGCATIFAMISGDVDRPRLDSAKIAEKHVVKRLNFNFKFFKWLALRQSR